MRRLGLAAVLVSLVFGLPAAAAAFCGFYVSGADASLYNNATMVVLLREGRTTVLSMQNNYQGPPEDFAMVVPVPVVLEEENVKTLPHEVFGRVDQLAAPRLVEYWEQDPCFQPIYPMQAGSRSVRRRMTRAPMTETAAADLGVRIEAEFQVAEYDVVILSAQYSAGLDQWLRQEQYNIPQGAERVLRPYVEAGTKFFVAKVDAERVTFRDGKAVLSPLRFHYDSEEFSLPVRLGLLNSGGQQDLLVHILARSQRYEVANYPNTTIPTNIRVVDGVRHEFGPWYDLLFRRAVASHPGSVVTEYSWDAQTCDPCPTQPLSSQEISILGGDVINQTHGFVLTRLHYRYGRDGLEEDLVFRAAPPIVGGRGMPDQEGNMQEEGVQPGQINNFQGRYVILHPWEGEIACATPMRGRWGGPPGGGGPSPAPAPIAAENQAMSGSVARGEPSIRSVGEAVKDNIPSLRVEAGVAEASLPTDPGPAGAEPVAGTIPEASGDTPLGASPSAGGRPAATRASGGGCASCSAAGGAPLGGALLVVLVAISLAFRRRR